jgi:hypothetical protein
VPPTDHQPDGQVDLEADLEAELEVELGAEPVAEPPHLPVYQEPEIPRESDGPAFASDISL